MSDSINFDYLPGTIRGFNIDNTEPLEHNNNFIVVRLCSVLLVLYYYDYLMIKLRLKTSVSYCNYYFYKRFVYIK